jgi:hypothetical protein
VCAALYVMKLLYDSLMQKTTLHLYTLDSRLIKASSSTDKRNDVQKRMKMEHADPRIGNATYTKYSISPVMGGWIDDHGMLKPGILTTLIPFFSKPKKGPLPTGISIMSKEDVHGAVDPKTLTVPVSYEVITQTARYANIARSSETDFSIRRIEDAVKTINTVNVDRYDVLRGDDIYGNTSSVCYGVLRHYQRERTKLPFHQPTKVQC